MHGELGDVILAGVAHNNPDHTSGWRSFFAALIVIAGVRSSSRVWSRASPHGVARSGPARGACGVCCSPRQGSSWRWVSRSVRSACGCPERRHRVRPLSVTGLAVVFTPSPGHPLSLTGLSRVPRGEPRATPDHHRQQAADQPRNTQKTRPFPHNPGQPPNPPGARPRGPPPLRDHPLISCWSGLGTKGSRRVIAADDVTAGSALEAFRGGTTPTKKRATRRHR